MNDLTLITTQDGSHSLQSERFDATYHSIFGAVDESIHVFLMAGLDYIRLKSPSKKQINILEIGFGTGLNVWLSALWAKRHDIKVNIHSLEKYPITSKEYQALNFADSIPTINNQERTLIQDIHTSDWNTEIRITEHLTLKKDEVDVLDHRYPTLYYDVIFFDAFAPTCQPELWESGFHSILKTSLVHHGILTTYCAKGVFKRMLKSIGYQLDQLPGPHRKHEMTRAINTISSI